MTHISYVSWYMQSAVAIRTRIQDENAIQIMKDDHYLDYVSNVNKDYNIYREGSYEFHNCLIDNY